MGRFFALTLDMLPGQIQTKTKKESKIKLDYGFWLIALLIISGIIYLMEVNNTSTKGYQIKDLERSVSELQDTNKRLQLEASSLQSIQNIENNVKTLNMVPGQQVQYVGQNGYALGNPPIH